MHHLLYYFSHSPWSHTTTPTYLDGNRVELPFAVSADPVLATFRIDANQPYGCQDPTPATPTTWGAIRGRYR